MLSLVNVEKLNGNNFKAWKHQIEMNLGMLEFNIEFKVPQFSTLTDESTAQERILQSGIEPIKCLYSSCKIQWRTSKRRDS